MQGLRPSRAEPRLLLQGVQVLALLSDLIAYPLAALPPLSLSFPEFSPLLLLPLHLSVPTRVLPAHPLAPTSFTSLVPPPVPPGPAGQPEAGRAGPPLPWNRGQASLEDSDLGGGTLTVLQAAVPSTMMP